MIIMNEKLSLGNTDTQSGMKRESNAMILRSVIT